MKLALAIVAMTSILGTSQAFAAAGHCHEDMAAISAVLAKAKLSDADAKTIKEALAKGEALHKAGKEEDCAKGLVASQKLLNIKDAHKH